MDETARRGGGDVAATGFRLGHAADCGGALLLDPINTRYATDTTNMQIWSMHDETRCVFVGPDGHVVLFDYDKLPYLAEGMPLITEYKVMPVFYYFAAGAPKPVPSKKVPSASINPPREKAGAAVAASGFVALLMGGVLGFARK